MIPKVLAAMVISALTVLALGVVADAQSKDPFVGTWEANIAKSKYTPGPAPTSITSTYEAVEQGYTVSVKTESASGPIAYSYTTNLDGKHSPITGNNPNADTLTVKRIDANTLESVSKNRGVETITQRNVISADGKTRTVTTTGVDPQGLKVHNVAVFEKN